MYRTTYYKFTIYLLIAFQYEQGTPITILQNLQ